MSGGVRRTQLLIGAAVVAVVLAVAPFALYFVGEDRRVPGAPEPPDAARIPDGVMPPVFDHGAPITASANLNARANRPEGDSDTQPVDQRRKRAQRPRRNPKQQDRRAESEPDEHGIYYTEDGKVDVGKMPPMGG